MSSKIKEDKRSDDERGEILFQIIKSHQFGIYEWNKGGRSNGIWHTISDEYLKKLIPFSFKKLTKSLEVKTDLGDKIILTKGKYYFNGKRFDPWNH